MQAALEIAAYVLGFTLFLGIVLVALLVKDLFWGKGFSVPHPIPQRLPTEALHEIRAAHKRLRGAYESAGAAGRQRLDLHLRRMRERVDHLELKTIEDQSLYYTAVTLQERAWKHWKAVHNQVHAMARHDRQRAEHHLKEAEKHFRQLARQVQDEWEKGIVRDRLNVEELRGLGLLDPDHAATLLGRPEPEPEPAPWDTVLRDTGQSAPAQPEAAARSRGDEQAAGMLTFRSLREIARGALVAWQAAKGRATQGYATAVAALVRGEEQPEPGAPEPSPAEAAPPAPMGPWRQTDVFDLQMPKANRAYGDPTFSVAELPLGTLAQADFSGTVFTAVEFTGVHRHLDSRFIGADLRGVVMARQERPHQFARCNFAQADFSGARLTFLLFHRCNLTGTRWDGAALDRVKFKECALEGVDWGGCDLSKVVFTDDARSADFSTAAAMPIISPPAAGESAPAGEDGPEGTDAAAESAPVPPPALLPAAGPVAAPAPKSTPTPQAVPPKE
jgi:hypothetical protein